MGRLPKPYTIVLHGKFDCLPHSRALKDTRPPRVRDEMPCRTAFSTNGCKTRIGTGIGCVPIAGSTPMSVRKRSPNRACSSRKYASQRAISSPRSWVAAPDERSKPR